MPPCLPWILWPAPCAPALLDPGARDVDLLVLHDPREAAALRAWCAGLALRGVGDGAHVPLARGAIGAAPPGLEARADEALRLPDVASLARTRVRLRAESDLTPRAPARARVFDLVRGDATLRSRAIATRADGAAALHVAFATDLHLAAIWDAVADAIARHAPDLALRFLHPRTHLDRLVAALNARAARGALDALVLGGDLVDHVYQHPRARVSGHLAESNVPALIEALASLRVPSFAIPGNHDFRLHPWRPHTYGLDELGIPRDRTPALLRRAGLWDPLPFRPLDLDALRTRERSGRSGLAQHLLHVAPATDGTASLGSLDLVFASTGRDLLPRWRSLEPGRLALLARALPTTWSHPDLEGLHDAQIAAIESALAAAAAAGRGAALFLHAPLLHPPERGRVEDRIERLAPPHGDDLAARVAFERRLRRSGLRRGVFFRNPAPLVRTILAARAPLAVFSGHVHRGHGMALDRSGGALRSLPFGALRSDAGRVALLAAPSLGQTDVRGEEAPGYLVARFEAGALATTSRHDIASDGAT
jgi:hypothetical protein